MKKTNRQRLLEWLEDYGSITPIEAARNMEPPMTALSQEINRLEKEGYIIEHIPEKNAQTHWTRYTLIQRPFKLELVGNLDN